MDPAFIQALRCPYCRSTLDLHSLQRDGRGRVEHGTVQCACYEYPIVDGIAMLRQTSGASDAHDEAVARLRAGDVDGARWYLWDRGSMVRQPQRTGPRAAIERIGTAVRRSVHRVRSQSVSHRGEDRSVRRVPVQETLEQLRPGGFDDYLFQRYANPSFVAAIPVMSLLERVQRSAPAPLVLDLACGVGHSTAMMRALFPSTTFVAAEPDFVNLHILRRHFVPDALCVCVDAELPLPFLDDQFDAVMCLDAFHYIRSKWNLGRELCRVVGDDGIVMMPHLHNAAAENVAPGTPLRAEDYIRLFDLPTVLMYDEAQIMERFMTDHVLDVSASIDPSSLTHARAFTLIASARADLEGRYDVGGRLLEIARTPSVGFNPIYGSTDDGGTVGFEMDWPNQQLEAECASIRQYVPVRFQLDRSLVERIRRGRALPTDEPTLANLVDTLAIVPLPPGYHVPLDDAAGDADLTSPGRDADG